ncbi:MAG: molybdopterin-dependent oxidoreductase, partial [Acidobacteriota bacterium]|nr:molybdopterin-dependent oxidoreductase [Acidobacteriota bacterium]
GFTERGFRFGVLEDLLARVERGDVKAVVLLHDAAFSSVRETDLLGRILKAVPFSLVLEVEASDLGRMATAWLPLASYVEESDFIVNHDGELRRYQKALEPPKGARPMPAWAKALATVPAAV